MYEGHVGIVKYLAGRECSIDTPDNFGRTPLFLALLQAAYGDGSHFEIAHFLFERRVNLKAQYSGYTLLDVCSTETQKAKSKKQ